MKGRGSWPKGHSGVQAAVWEGGRIVVISLPNGGAGEEIPAAESGGVIKV